MKNELKDVIQKKFNNKKAIPAYTINNLETIKWVMETSIKNNEPIILMVSPSGIKYFGGLLVVYNIFKNLKDELKANNVFLHLDHSLDKKLCFDAIDIGFDSVMFDGSNLPFENNVQITKEVVDYGKKHNVLVEGEIGQVGGKEDDIETEIHLATATDIEKFYLLTKVDLLAASIGTAHGSYKKKPELRFDILDKIKKLGVPLVLHGGSGIDDESIKKLISLGQAKINVNTQNQQMLISGLQKEINIANISDIRDINNIMGKYFKESMRKTIRLFSNV